MAGVWVEITSIGSSALQAASEAKAERAEIGRHSVPEHFFDRLDIDQ